MDAPWFGRSALALYEPLHDAVRDRPVPVRAAEYAVGLKPDYAVGLKGVERVNPWWRARKSGSVLWMWFAGTALP
jgi:hypothetical protein